MIKTKSESKYLIVIAVLYCAALITSNIIAGKMWAAPYGIVLPAAVFLFPIVYIIGDVLPEVYGLQVARRVIWLGFAANVIATLFFLLTISLPYPSFWQGQASFEAVLNFVPRLLVASLVGYLIGTNANAIVMVKVKEMTQGRFLWMRTISSTIVGETLDSMAFIMIAFFATMPNEVLFSMVFAQASFKILYEVIATPLTYIVVNKMKALEAD